MQVPIALLQIVWAVCDKYPYFFELYTTHTLCHVFFNKVSNTFSFEKLIFSRRLSKQLFIVLSLSKNVLFPELGYV